MDGIESVEELPAGAVPADQASASIPEVNELPPGATPAEDHEAGSLGQQVLTGIESAGRHLTFGMTDVLQSKLRPYAEQVGEATGINPDWLVPSTKDVVARKEENPWVEGGVGAGALVAGAITGAGAPGLISKAANAVVPVAETVMGRIGITALKGAIEAGLFQGGDEVSKAALGQGDPEAPVASAVTNMGAAALLGGVTGGLFGTAGEGLRKIGETQLGSKAAQLITDFGNRWNFLHENPDITQAVAKELEEFHGTTKAAADEVYGASGLKDQAIRKLVPEMNESITAQNEDLARRLQSKATEMLGDADTYPPRFYKMFTNDVNRWMETATDPKATSYDAFSATQELKQRLQSYAKYDKQIAPFAPEKEFVSTAKYLASQLRSSLEDEKVWGDAAKIQKGTNKAFTEFLPKLKDFESKFTEKIEGEPVISLGKVKTYTNQEGKATGEVKRQMMKNFTEAADKYRNQISDLHHQLGLESPIQPSSLNAVKSTLKESTGGADFADHIHSLLMGKAGNSSAVLGALGAAEGYRENGLEGAAKYGAFGFASPIIAKSLGKHITEKAVPYLLKAISSGNTNGLQDVLDHAASADRGLMKMNKAVEAIFKAGGQQFLNEDFSEKDREKLKKFVEDGVQGDQIKNMIAPQAPASTPAPGFAKGGDVHQPTMPALSVQPPQGVQRTNGLEQHFPEQNMLMQAAKTRVNGYLNSQRPVKTSGLPFDIKASDKNKENAYHHLLDMANKPLSILNKVSKGTLTPQDVNHFKNLYPEVYNQLSKKITDQITKAQQTGETPPYKTRQALGLFLGAHLDSSMTPQTILAAQQIYQKGYQSQNHPQDTQNQQQVKPPSSSSMKGLGKAGDRFKTSEQSVVSRQQRSK